MPSTTQTFLKSLSLNHALKSCFTQIISFLSSLAVNKLYIYIAKVNLLIMTLPVVKTIESEERNINPIDLRNFSSKKYYTRAACFGL